jgi:hypothetical protein
MQLQTKVKLSAPKTKIDLKTDSIFLIGSCFSDSVGKKLEEDRFKVCSNPFGVIFNPHSIFKLLNNALQPSEATFLLAITNNKVVSLDLHSEIWAKTDKEFTKIQKQLLKDANKALASCSYLIITLGTAVVYELKTNKEIVANCHKLPADKFKKRLLTPTEIISDFSVFYKKFRKTNPKAKILFTVSPVRHIKDTLPTNTLSKSVLFVAIQQIIDTFPEIEYFPSYEIQNDELRDYRFFKEDMIHPTEQAVNYIYDCFADNYFTKESKSLLEKWHKIKAMQAHKPLFPDSEEYAKFKKNLEKEIKSFEKFLNE